MLTSRLSPPLNRSPIRLKLAGVLLLVGIGHAASLFGFFLADDFYNLNNALRGGWSLNNITQGFLIDNYCFQDGWTPPFLSQFTLHYFRPVFVLSLLLDHAVWGLKAWGYHLTNILLHLMVVGSLFGILREWLPSKDTLALFGAAFYGLMPYHGMSVAWISGRTEILAALGIMVSLWAFLRFDRTRRFTDYILSVTAGLFALLSKETAVVLPLLLTAAWTFRPNRRHFSFLWLLPHYLLLISYLTARAKILDGFPVPPSSIYYHSLDEPGFALWALAKATAVFYDLFLHFPLVFPAEMILQQKPLILVLLAGGAIVIALKLFFILRQQPDNQIRRAALFALCWAVLPMLPTAPILIAPIYFYFSLAGVTLFYLILWEILSIPGRVLDPSHGKGRKRLCYGLLISFALALQVGNALYISGSLHAKRLLYQIAGVVQSHPPAKKVYLIDSPFISGPPKAGFEMLWPEHPFKLYFLSVHPQEWRRAGTPSRIRQLDPYTLEITAIERPYAAVGGAFAMGATERSTIQAGNIFKTDDYTITLSEIVASGPRGLRGVRQFIFRFQSEIKNPDKLFFFYSDGSFHPLNPF